MTAFVASSTSSRAYLERLLATDPDTAVAAVCERVDNAKCGKHGFVLAGAGPVGRWVAATLGATGAEVRCFADNRADIIGPVLDGIPVLSPAEAARRHCNATFVITIYNPKELTAQVEGLCGRAPVPWTALTWTDPQTWLPYLDLNLPHSMIAAADDVLRLFTLLGDEKSRRVLLEQVHYRLTLDPSVQGPPSEAVNLYAEPGVCAPTADDVYVDLGAFDGDSIAMHLERTGGAARRIIAVEADPDNVVSLRAWVSTLPDHVAQRISIHPVAIGAERGQTAFNARGAVSSSMYTLPGVAGENYITVDVSSLDELLDGSGASYIKMDVEGAEPLALAGAKTLLTAGKAVWATCVYHTAEHLWELPLQIAETGGAYRHALRRYAQDCWELVHYAVPVGR